MKVSCGFFLTIYVLTSHFLHKALNSENIDFLDVYKYIEQNDNIITNRDIKRYSIHLKTIADETFTYAVYPDNTLYVLKTIY